MTSGEGSGGTALVAPATSGIEQQERTLRSSGQDGGGATEHAPTAIKNVMEVDEEQEEERALEMAEEKMLLDGDEDDEEIASYDESGNPIVDTEQFERRMMTVALVNSVVETNRSKGKDVAALRAHGKAVKKEKPTTKKAKPAAKNDAPGKPEATAAPAQHQYGLRHRKKRELSEDSESPPVSPRSPRMRRPRGAGSRAKAHSDVKRYGGNFSAARGRQLKRQKQYVPNPLLNSAVATVATGNQGVAVQGTGRNRSLSISLTVPCPLPTGGSSAAAAAGEHGTTTTRRGRIFSIDIDPAGLDFPDMGIDAALDSQAVCDGSQTVPQAQNAASAGSAPTANPRAAPIKSDPNVSLNTRKNSTGSASGAPDTSIPFSVPGRDRAMSFEFFSFGINADEPLPDVQGNTDVATRPRGNSIIFDPVSFQDGGIHEEKVLVKGSRTNSLDIGDHGTAVSGGNAGYLPAALSTGTSQSGKPNRAGNTRTKKAASSKSSSYSASSRSQVAGSAYHRTSSLHSKTSASKSAPPPGVSSETMATLPSSLSGNNNPGLSHATFQMELLNKDGRIGIYLPEARRARIAKFHSKRKMRIWRKRIKYDCRKKLADSRPRIKGRFVKRSDMEDE